MQITEAMCLINKTEAIKELNETAAHSPSIAEGLGGVSRNIRQNFR